MRVCVGPRVDWRLHSGVNGENKVSALPRTLSRARNGTVTTVIARQVKPIRTTVEQPYAKFPGGTVADETALLARLRLRLVGWDLGNAESSKPSLQRRVFPRVLQRGRGLGLECG